MILLRQTTKLFTLVVFAGNDRKYLVYMYNIVTNDTTSK